MKIVFDLDHTLFKTSLFKRDFFAILSSCGAENEIIKTTYKKHCKEESGGAYAFDIHCSKIEKEQKGFDKKLANEMFGKFIADTDFSVYIEKESLECLKNIKNSGAELILLTKGGRDVQLAKFKKTGFSDIFDKFIICKHTKLDEIRLLKLGKDDYFINDLVEETIEIKDRFPQVNHILLIVSDPKLEFQDYSTVDNIPIFTSIKSLGMPKEWRK